MSQYEVHTAIRRLVEFATTCNTYVETSAPWKLAKDPNRADALDHVLFVLVESLRIIGVLISVILPSAARGIFYQLNVREELQMANASWGGLPNQHHLGKPAPLFPRIETA